MNRESSEDLSFGIWLRQRRRMLDLTQQELADQVGCARITLRRIEAGVLKPSKELALILLERLGTPAAQREAWLRFARGLSGYPGSSTESPAIKPLTNLPTLWTSFIGREKEQRRIVSLLGRYHLVTLVGPGGVGKTRLSLQAAQQILDQYPDGVWLVGLAPIVDSLLVPRITAIALGLRDEPQRPVVDMLCDYLRQKNMLIILDNCEHLIDACAHLVEKILQAAPDVRILATSREPLGIAGELIFQVPSLQLPSLEQLPPIPLLNQYEAVQLFIERATTAVPTFQVTHDTAPALAQICYRLDGIPLAIELAAAKVHVLGLEQINQRLDDRFQLLSGGSRTALPQHQTLQATLDWSYDLLSPAEKLLLQRLTVFVGGWTLEAAESICSDANIPPEAILDLLSQLIHKSLVNTAELHSERGSLQDAGLPFSMHETVRQYGLKKSVESKESNTIRDRHLDYFLNLAETAAPHLIRPEQLEWLARLNADYENLRAALDWALTKESPESSLRLCAALGMFWSFRGYWKEGSKWLENSLAKTLSNADLSQKNARVRALYTDAELSSSLDDIERMQSSATESFRLALEVPDKKETAIARFYVAEVKGRINEIEEARSLYEQSLMEIQELSEAYWELCIRQSLSDLLVTIGEKSSEQKARENLAFARKVGERVHLAMALTDVAYQTYRRGQIEEGEAILDEVEFLSQQIGFTSTANLGRGVIAHIYRHDYEKAKMLYTSYIEQCEFLGEKHTKNLALQLLGSLAIDTGQLEEAQSYLEASLALAREVGAREFIAAKLLLLDYVFELQARPEKSYAKNGEAILTIRDSDNQYLKCGSLQILADRIGRRKPEIGAKLLGTISSWRKLKNEPLDLVTKSFHDRAELYLHKTLGKVDFAAAFSDGQKMSMDEAFDLALRAVTEM